MKDSLGLQGEVKVEIIRAGKKESEQIVTNAVDTEIRDRIAKGLKETEDYGINVSLFTTDNFVTPTNTESGIVLHDASNNYEGADETVGAVPAAKGVRITSSTRRDGGTITLTGAFCGRNFGNGDFQIGYASTTFSQAVADGQQIDVTWDITIA